MYTKTISQEVASILEKISESNIGKDFYLAGGTALALQLGHRQSIDLDWFSRQDFFSTGLKKELSNLGKFEVVSEEEGSMNGLLDNVRVSFFYYDFGLLFPFVPFEKINLADERDIAAMKINAISSRGNKKDFIDIYFLLEKYSFDELIGFFERKYKDIKYNRLHILKSLTYFDDAENEPMPIMIKKVEWEVVKENIREKTNEFLKSIS